MGPLASALKNAAGIAASARAKAATVLPASVATVASVRWDAARNSNPQRGRTYFTYIVAMTAF